MKRAVRLLAVGDIHGCLESLEGLIAKVKHFTKSKNKYQHLQTRYNEDTDHDAAKCAAQVMSRTVVRERNMKLLNLFRKTYRIGQEVSLSGGYDMEPKWLQGQELRKAHIVKDIPGQNQEVALVIQFDEPFEIDGYTAKFAVLELRYEKAKWKTGETCHVEICDFMPDDNTWKDRKQGQWVESHATICW